MKKNILFLIILFFYLKLPSQVVIKSYATPTITINKGIFGKMEKITETVVPKLTDSEILKSIKNANKFAEPKSVDIDYLEKAAKEVIENYIVYRHKIIGLAATSIIITFDRLFLSNATELYIYDCEGTVITGPISSSENIGEDRTWSSNSFKGNSVVLELRTPKNDHFQNELHISKILLGLPYKTNLNLSDSLKFGRFDMSSLCNINVLCSQGNSWINERKAICLIETEIGSTGSGALIMNTCYTNKPYLLTAWHIVNGTNPNNWTFIFGWWSSTCMPNTNNQQAVLFNGASLRASYEQTDCSLLELFQTPSPTSDLTYLGWSRSSSIPSTSVGIHHPQGDQMKISLANSPATIGQIYTYPNTAWRVLWNYGSFEPGSSGSPLINADHRVIGQSYSSSQPIGPPCNQLIGGNNYGRFDLSWNGGGTNSTRLSNWLDPTGTNSITTNTTNVSSLASAVLSLSITGGNNSICNNGSSSIYTLNGAPVGASITWNILNPYIASLSSNGNQATVIKNSNGSLQLTATVGSSSCYSNNFVFKNIRLGTYTTSEYNITQWPTSVCNNGTFQVGMPWYYTPPAPNTTYNWYWGNGVSYISGLNTNVVTLKLNSGASSPWVMGRANNDCGQGPFQTITVSVNPYCYSSFKVSPNPSSQTIKIEPNNYTNNYIKPNQMAEIFQVELINKMGEIKYNQKFGRGINTLNISVNNFPNDIYTLRIFNGQSWDTHKVIIQH